MVLRYKDIHAFDNYWQNKKYLQYVQSGWGLRTMSMLHTTHTLGGGGTIYPGSRPADVTARSPKMVAECLLTVFFPPNFLSIFAFLLV